MRDPGESYDLRAAIEYNPGEVAFEDIGAILFELTGEHDGAGYHWIVGLRDGCFAYLEGGCDFTGWDCQSHLNYHRAATLDEALALVVPDLRALFLDMQAKGESQRDAPGGWT